MNGTKPIIRKIVNADPKTYIIFFVSDCSYCQKSLKLLKDSKLAYKGYNINKINGGMQKLLELLNNNAELLAFDPLHKTKPIIFLNGKFLGGYDQLTERLEST